MLQAIVISNPVQKSKGYGFVVFETEKQAKRALSNKELVVLKGNRLFCDSPNQKDTFRRRDQHDQQRPQQGQQHSHGSPQMSAPKPKKALKTARNEIDSMEESRKDDLSTTLSTRNSVIDTSLVVEQVPMQQPPPPPQPKMYPAYMRRYHYGPDMLIPATSVVEINWSYFDSRYFDKYGNRLKHPLMFQGSPMGMPTPFTEDR